VVATGAPVGKNLAPPGAKLKKMWASEASVEFRREVFWNLRDKRDKEKE
jgi:hypothetical protein